MGTVLENFNLMVRQRPDAAFLISLKDGGEEKVSWADASDRVECLAARLAGMGVRKGDRVAIISENRVEWVLADLAVMSVGAISVLVSAKSLTPDDVCAQLRDSGSRLVFVSERYRKLLCGVLSDVEIICFDDSSYSSLLEESAPFREKPDISEDNISTIIYTSGTTGYPRGVALTYGNYAEVCRNHSVLGIFPYNYSTLCTIPLCHCFMHLHFFHIIEMGGVLVMMRHKNSAMEELMSLEEDMRIAQPDVLLLVPALLAGIRQIMRIRGIDSGYQSAVSYFGGELKCILAGGARIDSSLIDFFDGIGISVYPGYGLTETAGGVSFNLIPSRKPGSIGRPLGDSANLLVYCEGLRTNQPGVSGEIIYRGGNLMKGYWNNEKCTAEVIDADGWFHTGDLGHFDSDGYLYFDGRAKSLLVSNSGEKYDPEEIECALREASPLIGQVMVYNQESPFTIALVVPAEGVKSLSADDMEAVASKFRKGGEFQGRFPDIWIPKRFLILDESFTVENGMLTPKGSLSRRSIFLRWKKEIETLYNSQI